MAMDMAVDMAVDMTSERTLPVAGSRPYRGMCIKANPVHCLGKRSAAKWSARARENAAPRMGSR